MSPENTDTKRVCGALGVGGILKNWRADASRSLVRSENCTGEVAPCAARDASNPADRRRASHSERGRWTGAGPAIATTRGVSKSPHCSLIAFPSMARRPEDVFPQTAAAWSAIARAGDSREKRVLCVQLTAIYREPLVRYVRAFGLSVDAEDVVHDVCAKMLDRRFIEQWHASGRPFRMWLRTAARHELMNRSRSERRRAGNELTPEHDLVESEDASRAFEHEYARTVIASATEATVAALEAEGKAAYWALFVAHTIDGLPYSVCAPPLGIDVETARHATARVRGLLTDSLRAILGAEQVGEQHLESELAALLRNARP